jgi:hypothetical protein
VEALARRATARPPPQRSPITVVDRLIVHGPPEQCREHLQRYVANGVTTPVIGLLPLGVDPRQAVARPRAALAVHYPAPLVSQEGACGVSRTIGVDHGRGVGHRPRHRRSGSRARAANVFCVDVQAEAVEAAAKHAAGLGVASEARVCDVSDESFRERGGRRVRRRASASSTCSATSRHPALRARPRDVVPLLAPDPVGQLRTARS